MDYVQVAGLVGLTLTIFCVALIRALESEAGALVSRAESVSSRLHRLGLDSPALGAAVHTAIDRNRDLQRHIRSAQREIRDHLQRLYITSAAVALLVFAVWALDTTLAAGLLLTTLIYGLLHGFLPYLSKPLLEDTDTMLGEIHAAVDTLEARASQSRLYARPAAATATRMAELRAREF